MKKILFFCFFLAACSPRDGVFIPEWLGGLADHRIYEERCGLYNFVFSDAEEKLKLDLDFGAENRPRRAVINLVNKLYKEHKSNRASEYKATIYYFFIDDRGVYDYEFSIDDLTVDRALSLNEECKF